MASPTLHEDPNGPTQSRDPPERDVQRPAATATTTESSQTPDEEGRDILAKALRNQAEDGPSTRRAAIRAYKYLYALVQQHGPQLQKVYEASKEHATRSKGSKGNDESSNTEPSHKNFPPCHHNPRQNYCTVCPHCLTRGRLPKSASTWTQQAFFPAFGRCRAEARSLHEHKQSERHLYKDRVGPSKLANQINQKTQDQQPRRPANPQPDCVSSRENSKPDKKRGKAQTKNNHNKHLPKTQRIYHCATPQNLQNELSTRHSVKNEDRSKTSGFGRHAECNEPTGKVALHLDSRLIRQAK